MKPVREDQKEYLQYLVLVAHRKVLTALSLKDMDVCMSILQEEIKRQERGEKDDFVSLKELKKYLKRMHKRKIESIKHGYYRKRHVVVPK